VSNSRAMSTAASPPRFRERASPPRPASPTSLLMPVCSPPRALLAWDMAWRTPLASPVMVMLMLRDLLAIPPYVSACGGAPPPSPGGLGPRPRSSWSCSAPPSARPERLPDPGDVPLAHLVQRPGRVLGGPGDGQ